MLFWSAMSQAMSQIILTDSDTFLFLFFFGFKGCCSAGGSVPFLLLAVYMGRCRKVPSVFILPSVCSHLFHFLFCVFGRACSKLINRDSASVSPTQRWKYNAAAWATVAAERPPGDQASLRLRDTVWNGCANIMQMHHEHITVSDGGSHLWNSQQSFRRGRNFINRTASPNQDRTDTDD